MQLCLPDVSRNAPLPRLKNQPLCSVWGALNCSASRSFSRTCGIVSKRSPGDRTSLMRIGITCYPTYGGSGVVATELGQELAARGHDIHFISYAPPIRMNLADPHIHFHEVEVASYPLFDHPPYTLALATKMVEERIRRDQIGRAHV